MTSETHEASAENASGVGAARDAETEQRHRGPGVAGPRSVLTAAARDEASAKTAEHKRRAEALRADGLLYKQIAAQLATEDGR